MAEDFTLFPSLPPEVRRLIWKQCLPKRVVELDSLPSHYPHIQCQVYWTTSANAKPPVITQVCHESRAVAMETGRVLKEDPSTPDPRFFGPPLRPWFNPQTDVICQYPGDKWGDYGPFVDIKKRRAYFLQLATEAQGVAVLADRIDPCDDGSFFEKSGWGHPVGLSRNFVKSDCKEYLVCLEAVAIHIDKEKALDSQVFGRLAEEPIQLVHASDITRIRQFHKLSSPKDSEAKKFFKIAFVERDYLKQLAKWRRRTEVWFVFHKWLITYQENPSAAPPLLDIWLQVQTISKKEFQDEISPTDLLLCIDEGGLYNYAPNDENQWVKSVLDAMPNFHPVIMFRHCELDCC
ncbi:hypothetical protein NUU61_008493 [Penicillium alfredii]|uniref:2EXR domain-containing protein n=1 Tax=Penicillium alfredii TaxID=1506179 RepID=A0A9W9ELH0_9EURO|nr:uncharacterized protein NUU61_008493 [Penicillium alfredii]KAJ5083914.1 hypothetical protein NUU61_008493 [Penicillium alfredii]